MLYESFLSKNNKIQPLDENGMIVLESVESTISSCKNKNDVMKKYGVTNSDIDDGKKFLSKNPVIMQKLKSCKSIKEIMNLMKSKEYKDAISKEKKES